jgi:hypothetical protein
VTGSRLQLGGIGPACILALLGAGIGSGRRAASAGIDEMRC